MNKNRIVLGKQGEEIAIKYLKKKGYRIIERNYHSHLGEIDIIASQKEVTVFIEVKTRLSTDFGLPQESVDKRKQYQVIRTALNYIRHKELQDGNFRFDVIGINLSKNKPEIVLIQDAFQL